MSKHTQKSLLKAPQGGLPYNRTLLDTTNHTPADMCDPVPFQAITNMLSNQFAREALRRYEEELLEIPYTIRLMADMIWSVGVVEYAFPDESAYAIKEDNGRYKMIFAYLSEEGTEEYEEGYIDPEYIDDVRDYIGRMSIYEIQGVRFNPDKLMIDFPDKKSIYYLLSEMVEDDEEFELAQPEEAILLTPAKLDEEDIIPYINAKKEAGHESGKSETMDFSLFFSPLKQFSCLSDFIAESQIATDVPITINMVQLYEMLVREGETNIKRPNLEIHSHYTIGIN